MVAVIAIIISSVAVGLSLNTNNRLNQLPHISAKCELYAKIPDGHIIEIKTVNISPESVSLITVNGTSYLPFGYTTNTILININTYQSDDSFNIQVTSNGQVYFCIAKP